MIAHHPAIHHRHYQRPAIVMSVGDERPVPLTDILRREYEKLYSTQKANPAFASKLSAAVKLISAGEDKYRLVSGLTNVPWYVIAAIHLMECDCNFACHLHNGDPLTARTTDVPKGRPLAGKPPFTWEESALDAIQYEKLDKWTDWSIAGTLYRLESYNGLGSRNHGVPTGYLWSGTNWYVKGKYGSDGYWNPKLVSEQIGAAPVLKALDTAGIAQFPAITPPSTNCEKN